MSKDRVEIYNLGLSTDDPRIVINMPLEAAKEIIYCFQDYSDGRTISNPTLAKLLDRVIISTESNTYAQEFMGPDQ